MYKKHILYCRPGEKLFNWENFKKLMALPALLKAYGRVKVTFEKYIPMKSLPQMGYYRGSILPFLEKQLLDETGMNQDDWHYTLKERFGLRKKDKSGNHDIVVSLKDYKQTDMSFFIKKLKVGVMNFYELDIPEPIEMEEYE